MNPWLETAGVILLALLGCWLGRWFSRLPKWYWTLGYLLPLGLVFIIGLARHWNAFAFTPPISWLMTGRIQYALAALIVTMVLTTPLGRLPNKRDRRAVLVFMLLVVWTSAVSIFLAPALNRKHLESLETRIDGDGICRQSNDYNCGPAAAVTALRKLGFAAEEGAIAILAHTSFSFGTPPDILAATLHDEYSSEGLVSEYRSF
jgi:MFS family permease